MGLLESVAQRLVAGNWLVRCAVLRVGMATIAQKLEALFSRVRALPQHQQERVVEALSDLTDAPYRLSDDELTLLLPELEGARRGEFASAEEVDTELNRPWGDSSRH